MGINPRLGTGEGKDPTTASTTARTVNHNDHVAAAVYLMKHAGVTALAVLDGQWPGRPVGIITKDDIVQAVAAGQDLNDVRIRDLMTEASFREVGGPVPSATGAAAVAPEDLLAAGQPESE
jgi:CBS domain-containing protein